MQRYYCLLKRALTKTAALGDHAKTRTQAHVNGVPVPVFTSVIKHNADRRDGEGRLNNAIYWR